MKEDQYLIGKIIVAVAIIGYCTRAFSELKMPYDTVVVADFADLECEASTKSVTGTRYEWTVTSFQREKTQKKNASFLFFQKMLY